MLIAQAGLGEEEVAVSIRPNTRLNINVAKPPVFSRKANKISRFLITYKLFIRMKIRNNIIEDLESGSLSYTTVGKFLKRSLVEKTMKQ